MPQRERLVIRVALAATPRNVVAVILRFAMLPLCVGLAVSVVAALLLSRLMASVLYEIQGTDPVTYVSAGLLLLVIGAAASARPGLEGCGRRSGAGSARGVGVTR